MNCFLLIELWPNNQSRIAFSWRSCDQPISHESLSLEWVVTNQSVTNCFLLNELWPNNQGDVKIAVLDRVVVIVNSAIGRWPMFVGLNGRHCPRWDLYEVKILKLIVKRSFVNSHYYLHSLRYARLLSDSHGFIEDYGFELNLSRDRFLGACQFNLQINWKSRMWAWVLK